MAENDALRRNFEVFFVEQLTADGVDAVASWTLLPQPEQLTESEIEKVIENVQADSVILTQVTGEEAKVNYVPPVNYGGYYSYYGYSYSMMRSPGYVQNYTKISLEMSLYDIASGKLVWSGQTAVTDYESNKKNTKLVVNGIIKDLQKQGMIPSVK